MPVTKEQIKAALDTIRAVAEAIREAGTSRSSAC